MAPFGDAVGLIARSEVRSRWRALLGLALLVALVGSVALSALAGARRTGSALDRFVDATQARDARIVVDSPDVVDDLVDALEDEDWVEAVARDAHFILTPSTTTAISIEASPQAALGTTVDGPLVLDGRAPAPDAADEIAIDEAARDQLDLDIGDSLSVGTFTPHTLECITTQECFDFEPGPDLELTVTGVVRGVDALQGVDLSPGGVASVAFFTANEEQVGALVDEPVVRLVNGADDLDRLRRFVADLTDDDVIVVPAAEDYRAAPSDTIDVFSAGLMIFAVLAALAGAVILLQAVGRQVMAMSPTIAVLSDLGLSGRSRAVAATLPLTGAAAAGAGLGVAVAIALSPRFPIGGARRIEPDPGVDVDLVVLIGGALVVVLVLTIRALLAARAAGPLGDRPLRQAPRTRSQWRPPIEAAAGLRLAFQRGRGRTTVPVRSALVGVTLGIAGLTGTAVVVQSTQAVVDDPTRWGLGWDATGSIVDPTTIRDRLPAMADEPGVGSVAILRSGLLEVNGEELTSHAFEGDDRDFDFVVVRGAPVGGDDEIALGESVLDDLGVDIGETVTVTDEAGEEHELTVVGTFASPDFAGEGPGTNAALTFAAWVDLAQSEGVSELAFTYSAGADRDEVDQVLSDGYGVGASPPRVPGRLATLDAALDIPRFLGAFFALVGALGLVHALVTSTRRRRPLFAVWRSVGFTPGQVRRSVLWQGILVTGAGLLIGLPMGLVVGRLAFARVIDDLGVVDTPSTPTLLLVLAVPVALGLALVLAALPAWSAARGPAARFLRTE
ncbi:MAG: FtsX-like permease family protein [Acidimicrobiales bacterium]